MHEALLRTELPDLPVQRGKVRDIYDLGDELLLVASDRISAFDVVMPNGIPGKGEILTRISAFWFQWIERNLPGIQHHFLELIDQCAPPGLEAYLPILAGRTMRVRKGRVLPIECVVRGYLTGSGWKEYQQSGSVCGVQLPSGLVNCQELPQPIFTPTTKASAGHDEPITFEQVCDEIGAEMADRLRANSLELYREAAAFARSRGIIIADTKFEWGLIGDNLLLVDEVLTPDSSRFWPADSYTPGREQSSFDKQSVRDYLESLNWNKQPPAPELPADVVANTRARYAEALESITGKKWH